VCRVVCHVVCRVPCAVCRVPCAVLCFVCRVVRTWVLPLGIGHWPFLADVANAANAANAADVANAANAANVAIGLLCKELTQASNGTTSILRICCFKHQTAPPTILSSAAW